MELARKAGTESLKFIKGEAAIADCFNCPLLPEKCAHWDARADIVEMLGAESLDNICYGAIMKLIFSEG
jgi:hypothetical protein